MRSMSGVASIIGLRRDNHWGWLGSLMRISPAKYEDYGRGNYGGERNHPSNSNKVHHVSPPWFCSAWS